MFLPLSTVQMTCRNTPSSSRRHTPPCKIQDKHSPCFARSCYTMEGDCLPFRAVTPSVSRRTHHPGELDDGCGTAEGRPGRGTSDGATSSNARLPHFQHQEDFVKQKSLCNEHDYGVRGSGLWKYYGILLRCEGRVYVSF